MKTLGKISGGLGLLLLLTSPFTLLLTSGSWISGGIKAGLGVALLLVWAITRTPRTAEQSAARAGIFYSSSAMMIVVVIAALAAINFIAAKRAKKWDLTSKQIHSLAPQTTQALQALKQPVRVLGFLGPNQGAARDEVESIVKRYAEASEKFIYEFKDPFKFPDLVAKYQLREGQMPLVLKYKRMKKMCPLLGGMLVGAAELLSGDDIVLCPVALHWTRKMHRGFNQAELLARHLGRARGWPVKELLRRVRSTGFQSHRSKVDRKHAMHDAFACVADQPLPARIVLIDDVGTTLSTLDACAAVLKHHGVARVEAAVVALG